MATLSKLIPGQVVYSLDSVVVGRSPRKHLVIHEIKVLEVYPTHVVAQVYGGQEWHYLPHEVALWKITKPLLIMAGELTRQPTKVERELLTTVARNNCP